MAIVAQLTPLDKLDDVLTRARNTAVSLFALADDLGQHRCVLVDIASKLLAIASIVPALNGSSCTNQHGRLLLDQQDEILWQQATPINEIFKLIETALHESAGDRLFRGHFHLASDSHAHRCYLEAQEAANSTFVAVMSILNKFHAVIKSDLISSTVNTVHDEQPPDAASHSDYANPFTVNKPLGTTASASTKFLGLSPACLAPTEPNPRPKLSLNSTRLLSTEVPQEHDQLVSRSSSWIETTIMTPTTTDENGDEPPFPVLVESNPAETTSEQAKDISGFSKSDKAKIAEEIGIEPAIETLPTSEPGDVDFGNLEAYVLRPVCNTLVDMVLWSYEIQHLPLKDKEIKAHLRNLGSDYSVLDSLVELLPEQLRLIMERLDSRQGSLVSFKHLSESDMVTMMGTFKVRSIFFVLRTSVPPESKPMEPSFPSNDHDTSPLPPPQNNTFSESKPTFSFRPFSQQSRSNVVLSNNPASQQERVKKFASSLEQAGDPCGFVETDVISQHVLNHYQTVGSVFGPTNISFEELRLVDKAAGRSPPRPLTQIANKFGAPQLFSFGGMTYKGLAEHAAAQKEFGNPHSKLFPRFNKESKLASDTRLFGDAPPKTGSSISGIPPQDNKPLFSTQFGSEVTGQQSSFANRKNPPTGSLFGGQTSTTRSPLFGPLAKDTHAIKTGLFPTGGGLFGGTGKHRKGAQPLFGAPPKSTAGTSSSLFPSGKGLDTKDLELPKDFKFPVLSTPRDTNIATPYAPSGRGAPSKAVDLSHISHPLGHTSSSASRLDQDDKKSHVFTPNTTTDPTSVHALYEEEIANLPPVPEDSDGEI